MIYVVSLQQGNTSVPGYSIVVFHYYNAPHTYVMYLSAGDITASLSTWRGGWPTSNTQQVTVTEFSVMDDKLGPVIFGLPGSTKKQQLMT